MDVVYVALAFFALLNLLGWLKFRRRR